MGIIKARHQHDHKVSVSCGKINPPLIKGLQKNISHFMATLTCDYRCSRLMFLHLSTHFVSKGNRHARKKEKMHQGQKTLVN